MYVVILLGVIILLSCSLILVRYYRRYNEIDYLYGKPYKARLVKLVGTHPELKSGIYSLSFHPNGAISFNQRVIKYSEIQSIEIADQGEKGEHNRKHLILLIRDDYGENQLYLTSKTEFVDIANELQRAWLRSKIC